MPDAFVLSARIVFVGASSYRENFLDRLIVVGLVAFVVAAGRRRRGVRYANLEYLSYVYSAASVHGILVVLAKISFYADKQEYYERNIKFRENTLSGLHLRKRRGV